jgi:glutamate mutase epsilon subunit
MPVEHMRRGKPDAERAVARIGARGSRRCILGGGVGHNIPCGADLVQMMRSRSTHG